MKNLFYSIGLIFLMCITSCEKKEKCMHCEMVTREIRTGQIISNAYPRDVCGNELDITLNTDPVYGNGTITKYECK
jgi:hypothetical protein